MARDLAGRVASVAVVAGALYSEPGECRPSWRVNGSGHQAPRASDGKPFAEVVWAFFAAHPFAG